ncbi:N-acetylglucosamine-6-phosphate deacetylase [Alicyclobacillus fastidiosus]|uniref:N-acetylglucosamine-6-phosphate deacetylase n=2 Tax=Alicyclobacillus fastidiosus TaxID=392011 RepID=A0ABY6ZMC8_9BACL|nr:N-acetylglucosamine-6-phosphate deacetylase [Alicyclobacillus fastidiosus]WAH43975.1 N-acetylglucosamine-6-phosphate deacetylase [Alicyclobacillus fastidiosus]
MRNELYSLWKNAKLYTPQGVINGAMMLVNPNGTIQSVEQLELGFTSENSAQVINVSGLTLLPGFIDIHVHGGNGFNVMDADYRSIDEISRFHAAHGTTSFLATTETASKDAITEALTCVTRAMETGVSGAEILGVHLEGPFLNAKRRGAQNEKEIRTPSVNELEHYLEASKNLIRLVTLAPEISGGMEAVQNFYSRGVTVSAGHTDATYEQVVEAIGYGVSHTTHHFNGMSPFHHRDPGVSGAGLMLQELTTELIADGIHVHPATVKLLFEVKSSRNICLITDAVTCCGLPDGEYGKIRMTNGQIYLKDGNSLAGSSLTTMQALKNAIQFTGCPLEQILPSLTEVPARQIGVDHRKGTLEPGKDADFLVIDENMHILATYVKGIEVYRSPNFN